MVDFAGCLGVAMSGCLLVFFFEKCCSSLILHCSDCGGVRPCPCTSANGAGRGRVTVAGWTPLLQTTCGTILI